MELKKVNLTYTVLLYLLTGGIYAIYWFITRSKKIYRLNRSNLKCLLPYFIAIAVIFYALVPIIAMVINFDNEIRNTFRVIFRLGFFVSIIVYIAIATIGSDIAKYIRTQETVIASPSCSPRKAFWLSFVGMISCIYLQRHINRTNRE